MVQKKIPLINSAHGSETRNIINELIKLFNGMGYSYDEALKKAHDTLNEAQRINELNNDTNERLDNIIADSGTSSTEVVDARGGHNVLSNRIDKINSAIDGTDKSSPLKKGIITFTLDNSYISTYTKVFPEFKSRGLKFAVSPGASSFARNCISAAHYNYEQLKEMNDYGIEVIAHGLDGLDLRKAGVPLSTAEYEIIESKKYWQKLGFQVNGYCGHSSLVHADYKKFLKVFDYAYSEFWSERTVPNSIVDENTDIYSMGRHSLYTDYTNGGVQSIKDAIDYVEQQKTSLHYYNHEVDTGTGDSIPLSVLRSILDYAATKNVEILLPTEAIQRLNGKLIATENISNIRSEMDGHINQTHDNLLSNSAYQGDNIIPIGWEDRNTITSGMTRTLIEKNRYFEMKYAFDNTDNLGKYVGLSQRVSMRSDNKPDIATFSLEVDSDSDKAEITINFAVQNTSLSNVSYLSKTIPLSVGKRIYEVSVLIPKDTTDSLAVNFSFYPKAVEPMTIIQSKPKLELSRSRSPWFAPAEIVTSEEEVISDTLVITRITNNNPEPDITAIRYATLENTAPTTITNFVTSEYNHEITFIFTNSNTTVTGSGLIRLKDGQNFQGNAGDVLTLIKTSYLSSAWYEKSRSKRTV